MIHRTTFSSVRPIELRSEPPTISVPQIPGYRVIRPIGSGGHGHVYLAVQDSLNREVVIKLLDRAQTDDCGNDIARFEREAALMAQGSHPNVVGVIDQGRLGEHSYIVMEYIAGGDLRSRLQPNQTLPLGEARPILLSIGHALTALHEKGIVHRDLKPENVLLDASGRARVTDFGIAARSEQIGKLTSADACIGTLDYMAPEQRHRLPIDERADQYALAFIAYEMLTGRRPLGIFAKPSRHNPELTEDIDDVILRGLQEDPDDRFRTVGVFTEAFAQSSAACHASGDNRGAAAFTRRRGGMLGGLIVLLSAIAGTMVWSRLTPDRSSKPEVAVQDDRLESAESPSARLNDPVEYTTASTAPPPQDVESSSAESRPSTTASKRIVVQQTGALAYRQQEGNLQILVIRSRQDTHWTIPKGTQKPRHTVLGTAAEEAFQDGGVRGTAVASPMGSYLYKRNGKRYQVTVFPVFVHEESSTWPEQFRGRKWCSPEEAAKLVAAEGLGVLLRDFDSNDL